MTVIEITTGVTYKLYSWKGTLLGSITVPDFWAKYLRETGYFRFPVHGPVRPYGPLDDIPSIKIGCLSASHDDRSGVVLDGISLEEFERMNGCSFSPSAAYLRSILE